MTCNEVRERLDDYVDGELASSELHALELHLGTCAACRAEELALRALLARAAALPKAVAPARDLWPGIVEEIEGGRERVIPFLRPALAGGLLAAAAAVLVAFLVPSSGPYGSDATATPGGNASPTPILAAASPESLLQGAEDDYERATRALLAALEEHREKLGPETLKNVERNLAVIDEALREVRAALDANPGNPELTRMLAATHRKKVDVLQRVVKLSTSRL